MRLRAAEHRDRHQPAGNAEAVEVALRVIAGDHVEHELGALAAGERPHLRGEVVRPVVDRVVGADRSRGFALRIGAARDDDRQAEQLAELDRHRADAAGAAVDQERFAVAGKPALEHVVPHGEQRLGHGGGLGQR